MQTLELLCLTILIFCGASGTGLASTKLKTTMVAPDHWSQDETPIDVNSDMRCAIACADEEDCFAFSWEDDICKKSSRVQEVDSSVAYKSVFVESGFYLSKNYKEQ